MSLTTSEWHKRYKQQAQWSQNLRIYLYKKAGLQNASNILDIGCGTGVLEHELPDYTTSRTFALDIDPIYLKFARDYAPQSDYTHCDALSSPFADHFFDVTFCHFLLLWVKNAKQTIAEMVRVTRLNGFVLALASQITVGGLISRQNYP
jgi:ubiquinone/menaquinone biosynthesis C-methylase UbiE